jgi:cytochrome P450
MITERRSGKSQSYSQDDLLSILINTDFFQGNDELIIDEVITFFLAGMKTIQISTTNLIYYLTKHQDIKRKLLAEILPPLEKVKDNIVEDFTYDTVMKYEYLQQCYSEVLRIEPPAANSVQ